MSFFSELNYYSKLMALKDQHGEGLFYTIQLGLMCAACIKSGASCTHKLDMQPEWKPPDRTAKVDAITAANKSLQDSETRGVITSSAKSVHNSSKRASERACEI